MDWITTNLPWLRWLLLALALGIILPLAAYAWKLRRALHAQRVALDQVGAKGREDARHSSRVLARAMLEDDLNVTEGAIRIKVMLDYLLPCAERPGRFPAIYALFDAAEGFARGPARKALPLTERWRQDQARQKLEAEYREQVLAEARLLAAEEAPA